MHLIARFTALLAFVVSVGCAHNAAPRVDPALEKVTNQAAFDLQCPKESLTAQKISDDHAMMGVHNATYGVRGCDKQATYKTSCGMGNCSVFNEAQATSKQ